MMVGAANSSSCSGSGGEEEWILGLPNPQTQLLEDDLWIKLEPEHAQSSPLSSITPSLVSPTTTGPYLPVTLPTPPHSPPTEHDLDELVASIPEILESPSATPPSDISDILSDLEGMETGGGGGWVVEPWWCPPAPPTLEESLKRDIMWGGGGCCGSLTPIKKERTVSECSADVALRDALRPDDFSDDDDDDGLPDTPSGTDSDCDAEDQQTSTTTPTTTATTTTTTGHHHHHNHHHSHHHNHHTHHHHTPSQVRQHHHSTLVSQQQQQQQQHSYVPPTVNSEHNYCGRVPDPSSSSATPPHGIVTPSDTEDEVDVVSCPEQSEASVGGNLPSAFLPNGTTTTTTIIPTKTTHISTSTNTTTTNNKCSADVKRQLQLAIQEAMRNRQNKGTWNEGGEEVNNTTGLTTTTGRLVSVKIKTQGKPAAYTKRMRDQHSEQVIRSSKHRRRGRGGESDEGRRSVHNSLERQRRIDLRNAFEHLRLLVPETKILEKAPKVQILKKAADHCRLLRLDEERLLREKEALVRQAEELKRRKALSS